MLRNEATSPGDSKEPAADVCHAIQTVLADRLHRPVDEITPRADLEKDLNVDSLSMIQVNIALEEQFQITMPEFVEWDGSDLRTVSDLAELVKAQIEKRSGHPEV